MTEPGLIDLLGLASVSDELLTEIKANLPMILKLAEKEARGQRKAWESLLRNKRGTTATNERGAKKYGQIEDLMIAWRQAIEQESTRPASIAG